MRDNTVDLLPPMPKARYLSSTVLFGLNGTPSKERGVQSPTMMIWGGFDGSTYRDDLWSLKMDGLSLDLARQEEWRAEQCGWRLKAGTANTAWNTACGTATSTSAPACAVREILLRAYCLGDYQSFGNL